MKVKDLIESIEYCKKEYPDFLDWEIYTEQIPLKEQMKSKEYRIVENSIDGKWVYFRATGFHSYIPDKKIFTININY